MILLKSNRLAQLIFLTAVIAVMLFTSASAAMETILKGLEDPSPIKRYEAIEALGNLGTPEAVRKLISLTTDDDNSWLAVRQIVSLKGKAVPYLVEALKDPNPKIVRYSIYSLGDLKCTEAVKPILGYLAHPDPEIRQNAVFALGCIKDPQAVEPLIVKLKDPDNVVREYAAAALEYFNDPRAIPHLKEALKREQGSGFNMATALYNMGDEEVIDILIEKLKDPECPNRLYAVYALGKIKSAREIGPLIESLTDENVQWLAAKALINLGDMAVPALLDALNRKERDIRLYTTYALGEIGNKDASKVLLDILIDPDDLIRNYACDALIKLKDRETLSRLYYYLEKGDYTIKSQVLKIFGAIGEITSAEYIYPLLSSESKNVRINAAFALGELQDKNAVVGLMKLLGDEDEEIGWMAADALIKIGDYSVGSLIKALENETGSRETKIIHILGKLKANQAVDILIKKLSSDDPIVRRYATAALTEISDPAAEEHLVMMISDPDPAVRIYAAVGLMEFGGKLSVKLLLNALKSDETRWLAVRILDKIGPRGVDELISALQDPKIQWYASQTLIKLDGAILPELEEGLRSDEEIIRNNIALILGEVKDKRAVSALLDAMQDESRSVSLAASSLVSIGDPSAVEPLIQCLLHHNEQVRLYAAYALGHLRDRRAVDPLIQCLKDPDSSIRGISAYSLGLIRSRKAALPLLEVLKDEDENVRLSAVYALGKIKDSQVTPFIKDLSLKDPSHRVRKAAVETLEQMALRWRP